MRFNLRSLLLVITLLAVLTFWFKDYLVSPYSSNVPKALLSPLWTTVTKYPNGELSAGRYTYSHGIYGISEIGNVV